MSRFVILCPVKRQTGGVQLLYQLSDAINKSDISSAVILPVPFNAEPRNAYSEYLHKFISYDDLSDSDVVIFPETLLHLLSKFKKQRRIIWWLSVDNYFGSRKLKFLLRNMINPLMLPNKKQIKSCDHLVQSHYAMKFVESTFECKSQYLGDFLSDEFLDKRSLPKKINRIAYNPAKDNENFRKFRDYSGFNYLALENMTRSEMILSLSECKIYIDFGNHPGMDRIPREAAILNCCILTNRAGSADYYEDIPIPDEYKVYNESIDNSVLKQRLHYMLMNYDNCIDEFAHYRTFIRAQKLSFYDSVQSLCLRYE